MCARRCHSRYLPAFSVHRSLRPREGAGGWALQGQQEVLAVQAALAGTLTQGSLPSGDSRQALFGRQASVFHIAPEPRSLYLLVSRFGIKVTKESSVCRLGLQLCAPRRLPVVASPSLGLRITENPLAWGPAGEAGRAPPARHPPGGSASAPGLGHLSHRHWPAQSSLAPHSPELAW